MVRVLSGLNIRLSQEYPAHLHIDILPRYQRRGLGGKLILAFVDKIKGLLSPIMQKQMMPVD
jgi:GNAT superfamily N-acetyltransferase